MLAMVAAVSAACHNRSQDEVGAAPARGDTTAVRQDAGVTADSTGVTVTDSTTVAAPADSTSAAPTDTTAAPKQ